MGPGVRVAQRDRGSWGAVGVQGGQTEVEGPRHLAALHSGGYTCAVGRLLWKALESVRKGKGRFKPWACRRPPSAHREHTRSSAGWAGWGGHSWSSGEHTAGRHRTVWPEGSENTRGRAWLLSGVTGRVHAAGFSCGVAAVRSRGGSMIRLLGNSNLGGKTGGRLRGNWQAGAVKPARKRGAGRSAGKGWRSACARTRRPGSRGVVDASWAGRPRVVSMLCVPAYAPQRAAGPAEGRPLPHPFPREMTLEEPRVPSSSGADMAAALGREGRERQTSGGGRRL